MKRNASSMLLVAVVLGLVLLGLVPEAAADHLDDIEDLAHHVVAKKNGIAEPTCIRLDSYPDCIVEV